MPATSITYTYTYYFISVTIACNTTFGPHSVNVLPFHIENDTKGDFVIEPSARSELLADHPGLVMIAAVVNTETVKSVGKYIL